MINTKIQFIRKGDTPLINRANLCMTGGMSPPQFIKQGGLFCLKQYWNIPVNTGKLLMLRLRQCLREWSCRCFRSGLSTGSSGRCSCTSPLRPGMLSSTLQQLPYAWHCMRCCIYGGFLCLIMQPTTLSKTCVYLCRASLKTCL